MINEEIRQYAESVYNALKPYCIAIYLGGSYCQDYIKNKGDVDFICFSDRPVDKCNIRRLLYFYFKKNERPENYDFIQVRTKQQEEHAYGSYINKEMIKLIGQDIPFTFDIINKDRAEYKQILIDTVNKLNTGKIKNQKRWYQILRGYFILKNNSYKMSEAEKDILNKVHDQENGWEQYKITINEIERI